MAHTGPREFILTGVSLSLNRAIKNNPELEEVFTDFIRQLEEQRIDTERALTDTDELKTDNMRVWMGA